MRIGVIAAALVGLALAVWLLFHIGIDQVFSAVASVGIAGFLLLCLAGFAVVALLGCAWCALIPGARPRDTHFADRAVYDFSARAWLSVFLERWIG